MRSVLFLTNAYPDFESSYRGIFVKKMALYLTESGYQISVVTPKIYGKSLRFETKNGTPVYRFPFFAGNKLLIEHKRIPYFRMIVYYLTGFLFTIFSVLRSHCDVIHVHWAIPTGFIGVVAGKLFRKPLVVTIHGSDLRMAMAGSLLLKKIFVRVCQSARHVHLVSESMRNAVKEMGIPEEKISVWPMGIDEEFLQVGKVPKYGSAEKRVTVLSNRNLLPIYDISCLIRAIPLVLKEEAEIRFLIVGEGADKENLEKEVEYLNVRSCVRLLGRVPHEQMPELLSRADIYVSTSLFDGTSVSLMEALAVGLFPVVTDIPSNREWIRNGENGFLVPVRNERELADRIIEAVRSRELVERAVKQNREIVTEKAHWKKNIQDLAKIYENCFMRG